MYGYGYGGMGSLMSFLPLLVIIFVAVVIIPIFSRGKMRGGVPLVLKEFKLNENEDEFLKISGRTAGLIGWLLSQFGIDPITTLTCNKKSIKFEDASIQNGKSTLNIPLASITAVQSGITKPFVLIVLGCVFIIGGIFGAIALGIFGFVKLNGQEAS